MTAWAKDQGVEDSMITFLGDPTASFTKAVGMELTHEGPIGKGLLSRCKRFAMLVDDSTVKGVAIAESEFDPAGDDFPEKTLTDALLAMVKEAKTINEEPFHRSLLAARFQMEGKTAGS